MLAARPAGSGHEAMSAIDQLTGVAINAAQLETAIHVLAALPHDRRDVPAVQALALRAYACEAGIDDEIGSAALHARVTALAASM